MLSSTLILSVFGFITNDYKGTAKLAQFIQKVQDKVLAEVGLEPTSICL
jgi:hypothetical protein